MEKSAQLDVTVVVVPRERYSYSELALEQLLPTLREGVELVYVSAGTPARIEKYLEYASIARGFRLISVPRFLTPNEARNLAIPHVRTQYVVFLDNDTVPSPGWLERLVSCAEETRAAIVGPLYLIGDPEEGRIHMAGGEVKIREEKGIRHFSDRHKLVNKRVNSLAQPLTREPCDYVEFHCMLIRMDFLRSLNGLDENLLSIHEHIDIAFEAQKRGLGVVFEPTSVITYKTPPPLEYFDLPFYRLRWSEDWSRRSIDHFARKWNFSAAQGAFWWTAHHRSIADGYQVPACPRSPSAETALEHAQLMLTALESVGIGRIDLVPDPRAETASSEPAHFRENLDRIPALLKTAERDQTAVRVRGRVPSARILVRLLGLDAKVLEQVRPLSFLALKTGPGAHECWLLFPQEEESLVRKLGEKMPSASVTVEEFESPLAGSCATATFGPGFRISHVRIGQLCSMQELLGSLAASQDV